MGLERILSIWPKLKARPAKILLDLGFRRYRYEIITGINLIINTQQQTIK